MLQTNPLAAERGSTAAYRLSYSQTQTSPGIIRGEQRRETGAAGFPQGLSERQEPTVSKWAGFSKVAKDCIEKVVMWLVEKILDDIFEKLASRMQKPAAGTAGPRAAATAAQMSAAGVSPYLLASLSAGLEGESSTVDTAAQQNEQPQQKPKLSDTLLDWGKSALSSIGSYLWDGITGLFGGGETAESVAFGSGAVLNGAEVLSV